MRQKRNHAFTAVELLVVILVCAIAFFFLMHSVSRSVRTGSIRIRCVSNLRNIALGFHIIYIDLGDKFPAPALSNDLAVAHLRAAGHFAYLSNELSTPKLLLCPKDESRRAATNFVYISRENISYFSSLSASIDDPRMWLAGDRNLIINSTPAAPVQITLTTNDRVGWTSEIHIDQGNVAMADGSVQKLSNARLQHSLKETGNTNLLVFP